MAAIAVAYGVFVHLTNLPSFILLGIFVPVMLSVEWAIESRRSFCVRLALAGRYRFTDRAGVVDDPNSQKLDARAALRITALAALIGGGVTALVYTLALSV